jgi:hypothetical protein
VLPHVIRRIGTTATNMCLQDPIPSMRLREGTMNGAVQNVANAGKSNVGSSIMVNMDGRINAVHHEISTIKTGILVAQLSILTRPSKPCLGLCFHMLLLLCLQMVCNSHVKLFLCCWPQMKMIWVGIILLLLLMLKQMPLGLN